MADTSYSCRVYTVDDTSRLVGRHILRTRFGNIRPGGCRRKQDRRQNVVGSKSVRGPGQVGATTKWWRGISCGPR